MSKFQNESVLQKKQLEPSKDERPKPTPYKSSGIPRKDKDFVVDFKDYQVPKLHDTFLGGIKLTW